MMRHSFPFFLFVAGTLPFSLGRSGVPFCDFSDWNEACPPRLLIANKEIVKARVDQFNLVLEWSDGKWETWEALQSSEELGAIRKEVQSKLDTAKTFGLSKGKGKNASE